MGPTLDELKEREKKQEAELARLRKELAELEQKQIDPLQVALDAADAALNTKPQLSFIQMNRKHFEILKEAAWRYRDSK